MKQLMFAVALLASLPSVGTAGDIVIPEDKTPFGINLGDVVRIPVKAVAGTQVKARVSSSSQVAVQTITNRVKGKEAPGTGNHEVEVKPKGKGQIKLYVTISPPNGKETTDLYEFEVK
ncbi:Uncharacterized protein OS=Blastopirellula marina DSM 3645 GN=DSM3645_18061 PE=4 SV=1 [Gemmata massiliana]|uniref:Uncharacterized protein n=1 Tax=Gemmata massiliana TaxID=1210884 RepID=A0A6P2CZM1_9BACT|nr:hypothetical protein [Gemmata massiliana]VTR92612.1 Uncharacterized protein OS=Blastopirellula marina DSM 3645 GN=DSM3645_18061 PE=4 SV=1 [Gemmata massiliana]